MPPSLRRIAWAGSLLLVALPAQAQDRAASSARSDGKPRLDWSKDVWCVTDAQGREFRVQDDRLADGSVRLLVAPNEEASGKPLDRVRDCKRSGDWATTMRVDPARVPRVSAVAEAPPGWHRDHQGRVFQVAFDLRRRFHVGAGWQPSMRPDQGEQELDRAFVEMGLEASWLNPDQRMRHTIRAAEGNVTFDDLRVDGTLFSYEMVRSSTAPMLRFTTFFGEPQRYDTRMDMGFGLRVLHVQHRPHGADDRVDVEMGEAHAAWYPWHSADLFDHVRITAGAMGGGQYGTTGNGPTSYYAGPKAGIDTFFNLDRDGFHYVDAGVAGALPIVVDGDQRGTTRRRASVEAGYEVIFLAINDQPLSLRLKAGLDWRDDLPDEVPRLEGNVFTGMRFSFWAPARDRTPLVPAFTQRSMDDVGRF